MRSEGHGGFDLAGGEGFTGPNYFIVIRHGVSELNRAMQNQEELTQEAQTQGYSEWLAKAEAQGLFALYEGHESNAQLIEQGELQSKADGHYLKDYLEHLDRDLRGKVRLYRSNHKRSEQSTANIMAVAGMAVAGMAAEGFIDDDIKVFSQLGEQDFGYWSGYSRSMLARMERDYDVLEEINKRILDLEIERDDIYIQGGDVKRVSKDLKELREKKKAIDLTTTDNIRVEAVKEHRRMSEQDESRVFEYHFTPPNGNSPADLAVKQRGIFPLFFGDAAQRSDFSTIVIVTHGISARVFETILNEKEAVYYSTLKNPENGQIDVYTKNRNPEGVAIGGYSKETLFIPDERDLTIVGRTHELPPEHLYSSSLRLR